MKKRIADRVAGIAPSQTLAITAKAKAMKATGEPVISFGVGEPDFNTPDFIIAAAKEAMDKGCTKYTPSSGLPALRQVICEKFERENGLIYEPSQIIVSNGAKHSLFNACFATIEPGDEVIIPAPYWLTYPELVRVCGGVPVVVNTSKENGFKMTAQQLKDAITPKTKMLIFTSPSNPTGAVYTKDEINAIAAVCEEAEIYILADEIYEKLVYDGAEAYSIANYSQKVKDLTITVNGVSKTFAMTGWRIGYLAAPKDVAKAIDSFQSHGTSNPNSIAQYATIAALNASTESIDSMVAIFAERRAKMMERMDKIENISYVKPYGAFYVMMVIDKLYGKKSGDKVITNSVEFAAELLEKQKVAVIPGVSFGADDCIRLSYSLSMEDMLEGLDRIDAFVQSLQD